jgi:hypothetical protein
MKALPKRAKHPVVIAAFVAGLFAIVAAIVPVAMQRKSGSNLAVQTGGLYRNLYHSDGSWQAYVPEIHSQERFWIALNVVAKKDVSVNIFSIGGIQFEGIFLGYRNQEMHDTVRLTKGESAWLSVPIELDRWAEVRGSLSSKTICLLLDPQGKAVAEYELPAIAFPQE